MRKRKYGIWIKNTSTNEEFNTSFENTIDVVIHIETPQGELIKAFLGEVIDTMRRHHKFDLKM